MARILSENRRCRHHKAATKGRGSCICILSKSYIERQLALVRARMPMKLGTKTVEANTTVIIARYIWFSSGAATGILGLRRSTLALLFVV